MVIHELGMRARDKITGFTGIITTRAEYITGPRRYCLENSTKDNKVQTEWFDEQRIIVIDDPKLL